MFKNNFSEGLNLYSRGRVEMPLPDDNPAALLIILHLVHGQIRKVPRKVGFWMLIEIAILVDKYELLESVEMMSDYWFQNLDAAVPVNFNNDVILWMCLSWVFKKRDVFEKVTRIAQIESKGLLETYQLPIPEYVLGKIFYCH